MNKWSTDHHNLGILNEINLMLRYARVVSLAKFGSNSDILSHLKKQLLNHGDVIHPIPSHL